MKNKKLNLNELKVKSFVTNSEKNIVKGGGSGNFLCETEYTCDPDDMSFRACTIACL